MSTRNAPTVRPLATDGRRLYVAIYLRKSPASNDAIEASIDQQREQVRAHCAKMGWIIVAEYCDEGKSGSRDQDERHEFRRMIGDAGKGEWSAVVVWHSNRFARLDILDVAEDVRRLRAAGVHLESVKQGTIDATTPQGRMMLFMNSETDSGFAKNISADSIRGRVKAIAVGDWPHGRVPFGYSRELFEGDMIRAVVKRGEKMVKPGNWRQRLVIERTEADGIRWMFERFAASDISLRQLARELHARGILKPDGGEHWHIRSMTEVLRNPVYRGALTMGLRKGGIKGAFNIAEPVTREGVVPAIVSPETWHAVNDKLDRRAKLGERVHSGRTGTLAGVLACGNCGSNLIAKGKKTGRTYYTCKSVIDRPSCGCKQWRAYESEVLPQIVAALVQHIDGEVLKQLTARPDAAAPDPKPALRQRIADLDEQVREGAKRLLKVPPKLYAVVEIELDKMQAELDGARNTLAIAEGTQDKTEVQRVLDWWEASRATFIDLTPDIGPKTPDGKFRVVGNYATPDTVRAMLKNLNTRCVLSWTPNGKRYHELERGVLTADFGEHLLIDRRNTRR